MAVPSSLEELSRVDEPRATQGFSAVLTQVAAEHWAVIVRRDGEDLAAVIPLDHLEILLDAVAHQEVEKLAAKIGEGGARPAARPPQTWFDDNDNPFEPEEGLGP